MAYRYINYIKINFVLTILFVFCKIKSDVSENHLKNNKEDRILKITIQNFKQKPIATITCNNTSSETEISGQKIVERVKLKATETKIESSSKNNSDNDSILNSILKTIFFSKISFSAYGIIIFSLIKKYSMDKIKTFCKNIFKKFF